MIKRTDIGLTKKRGPSNTVEYRATLTLVVTKAVDLYHQTLKGLAFVEEEMRKALLSHLWNKIYREVYNDLIVIKHDLLHYNPYLTEPHKRQEELVKKIDILLTKLDRPPTEEIFKAVD